MGIRIESLRKSYKEFDALKGVNLNVRNGELVALLGPSGSGKTTLLRIIAGLDVPDSGSIFIDQPDNAETPAATRRIGFVFQHYALFRHMTVYENIAFGLRVQDRMNRPDKATIKRKVMKLLDLVQLPGLQDRYPSQLSGGQRQRVALARVLAVDPKVLLLDEPFGALDAKVRKELRRWLRKLHDDMNITTIFVTHDQEEAMELADRVIIMNEGRIEQAGTPEQVYHNPATAFVYDFLGNYNAFEAWKKSDEEGYHILKPFEKTPEGAKRLNLFARPHDVDISLTPQDGEAMPAKIIHINPAGPLVSFDMEGEDGRFLQAALTKEQCAGLDLRKGQIIYLKPREVRIF